MANTDITPNCLIILSGSFNALSLDRVFISITVPEMKELAHFKLLFKTEFAPPYNNTALDILQIYYPRGVDEKPMQLISAYFKGDPPTDLYHIVASPYPTKFLENFLFVSCNAHNYCYF